MEKHDEPEFSRFLDAQSKSIDDVLRELAQGRKKTHWMWYIFPQLKGLGSSSTAQYFGIENLDQAQRYVHHDVLSERLCGCTKLLLRHQGKRIESILGSVDALKLRSSMTLFQFASDDPEPYSDVLTEFYKGTKCEFTLRVIKANQNTGKGH